jgi:hypothetical protein
MEIIIVGGIYYSTYLIPLGMQEGEQLTQNVTIIIHEFPDNDIIAQEIGLIDLSEYKRKIPGYLPSLLVYDSNRFRALEEIIQFMPLYHEHAVMFHEITVRTFFEGFPVSLC